MGAWFLCRSDSRAEHRLATAKQEFGRAGLPAPIEFSALDFRGISSGYVHSEIPTFLRDGGDFIVVAGTLFYRGQNGAPALKAMLADYEPPFDRWGDVLGHFGAVIFKRGRLFVLGDWSGAFHVYRTPSHDVISTSFLAIAQSQARLSFNVQSIYEFVFAGTAMGSGTVFNEITRLPRTEEIELQHGAGARVHASSRDLLIEETVESKDELVDRISRRAGALFSVPAQLFRDRIQCPLSGGFDSRLVLALLQEQGVRPHVYVYGGRDDVDVQVATEIASAENFELEVFDKSAFQKFEPDAFVEAVDHNFHEMDGTPMDGGLFDLGGNSEARHQRARGGSLAASGAAGEIFRNYFYLANRRFKTRAVIDAFYAGYDPRECSSIFDERSYLETLDQKLRAALKVGSEPIERLALERAYPLFRCPAAFGREISMVSRFGPYFVPFCEYALIREAAGIPFDLRNFGRFQSALLTKINPRLANYPSAYGHSFTQDPSLRHRMSVMMSLARPPWLRRFSFRMKQAIAPARSEIDGFLAPDQLARVIDLEFPFMRQFFNIENVRSRKHFGAVATLEYLFERLSDRITFAPSQMSAA